MVTNVFMCKFQYVYNIQNIYLKLFIELFS